MIAEKKRKKKQQKEEKIDVQQSVFLVKKFSILNQNIFPTFET